MSETVKIECSEDDPTCTPVEEALLDEATNAIDAMGSMDSGRSLKKSAWSKQGQRD